MWDQERTGESGETGAEDAKSVDDGESGRDISNNFHALTTFTSFATFCSTQLLVEGISDNHPGGTTIGPSFDEFQTIDDLIFILAEKPPEFLLIDIVTLHDR